MKFYRRNGIVFAFDDDQLDLVESDMIVMSDAEVTAHLSHSPQTPTRDDIERQRLIAYADPIVGSDRYFSEAARLTAMSATDEDIAAATAAGVARAAEIAAMYPWPENGDTA